MAETSRDLFASRLGMLAATLGSSVGLGNIWKFPALTGEHGGASFLLVYILSTLVVGLPLMIAELLIGRSTRSNAYQAFKTLSSNRFWWIGHCRCGDDPELLFGCGGLGVRLYPQGPYRKRAHAGSRRGQGSFFIPARLPVEVAVLAMAGARADGFGHPAWGVRRH